MKNDFFWNEKLDTSEVSSKVRRRHCLQLGNPSVGGGSSGVEGPLKILKLMEGSRRLRRRRETASSPSSSSSAASSDESFSYKSLRKQKREGGDYESLVTNALWFTTA